MSTQNILQIRTLSSLAKVFPERICGRVSKKCEAVCGQEVSFQVAFRLPMMHYCQKNFQVAVTSPLSDDITLYRVGNVPSSLPAYPDRNDENYLTLKSGFFPDPLFPLEDGTVCAAVALWRAVWISVRIPADCKAGKYPVRVSFSYKGETVSTVFQIHVRPYVLPKQKLLYTQWFHCDCIADAHGVPVLSEAHWRLIEKYMRLAAEHGMNMILTPVVTPPLDTAVGGERPTVQLVDITKNGLSYSFDFTKLGRFVNMARSCGIENFEISHLFTQWGVAHAPKIVAYENGELHRIFGWETDAVSEEYVGFLRQFVPALLTFFADAKVDKKQLWFHVSDEPGMTHLDAYRAAAEVLCPMIDGCHHMDALSDLAFYKEGLLSTPVVATNHIEPYLEAHVPGLWCYYCCGQDVDVSNRFFAMPSARTRIIGVQLYKFGIEGFLQWGYNFYYSARSERKINPYFETCGNDDWPSGDPFSVYPYKDGVIPSLRQKVFANALEDIRLLTLLEERIGRERVIAAIDRLAGAPITFAKYPKEETFFADLYQMIFEYLD